MPELPEVETVVRELQPVISGRTISKVESYWHKTVEFQATRPPEGQRVERVGRRGKYILIALSGSTLVIHLRMTGQILTYQNAHQRPDVSHARAEIFFSDGSGFVFNDSRKFGRLRFVDDVEPVLAHVGLDALDKKFTKTYFDKKVAASRQNIKALLLSQKLVSGIGNIYADEALFRAGINPASEASQISSVRRHRLYSEIQSVLRFAIEHMGATISDYRDPNGNMGQAQHFFRVYQQQGKPCVNCGNTISKVRIAGRGTHFCGKCQKLYVRNNGK